MKALCAPRLPTCARLAAKGENVMPASIAAAKAGCDHRRMGRREMRAVHGEYRGPTGVSKAVEPDRGARRDPRPVDAVSDALGRRLKFVVGKPGLDGHSNGAEQIAFARARLRDGYHL
jgi:(2R)-ethylmalonyl-CoA mutase